MEHTANRRSVLLVMTVSAFLTPFMSSAVNIALPSIAREFAMDAVTLSWMATAYSLAAALFLLPFGRIADIYGRKRVFVAGMIAFALGSVLVASSPITIWLLIHRALQGLGAGMIFSTGVAILTSAFAAGERGRVLGINVAATYAGLSVGPFLGGQLTASWGWRSIFWCTALLGGAIIALTCWQLRGEWAEARGERFDLVGSLVYGVSLVALMYGFSRLPVAPGGVLAAGGLLGLALFVWWESRSNSPVLHVGLFWQNPAFAFSNLAALISYTTTSAVGLLLSLYLQNVRAMSAQSAGVVLVSQPAIQAALSPLAGRLSDQIEPRRVASLGMALTSLGLIIFVFISATTLLWIVITGLMLLGLGFALFSSPNVNAVMSCVDRRRYGVASATLATMRVIGQMLSTGAATLVFAVVMGRVQITPESSPLLVRSIKVVFAIFAALCLVGIRASLARGNVLSPAEPQAEVGKQ